MKKGYLRKAERGDAELLFQWANEEEVRKNSLNTAPISYEEHIAWFQKKLSAADSVIYIYCFQQQEIGQIRLDYKQDIAWISYSIDKRFRGFGHGKQLLLLIEEVLLETKNEVKYLAGIVKKDNLASQKKFEEAGYDRYSKEEEFPNCICYKKERQKSCIA